MVMPTRLACAISFRTAASPPRVGSRIARVPGAASRSAPVSPFRAAQSLDIRLEIEPARLGHDRHAMIAQCARDQDPVAGPDIARAMATPSRTIPKPVVEMKTPSPLPRSTTLVSPVTISHAGRFRGLGHRTGDPVQIGQRQAFFEDEADRQREGLGPAHGHVVDRAVHRKRADVAAGEEERRDDEPVGGDREPARGQGRIA
jgi:hypothetical protein